MKSFYKKHSKKIMIVAAVLVIAGGFWYVIASRAPQFATVTAQKGNVIQSLDEPGNMLSENSADLSFQVAGQITTVNVKEGDKVEAGDSLVSLDTSALGAAVDQANAALAAAQANLDKLESGTRPEQLTIDEAAVQTASTSLGVAAGTAYDAVDDAVQNQTDALFMNPNTNAPVFIVPYADSQSVTNIESKRVAIGASLVAWNSAMTASSSNPATLAAAGLPVLQQAASYLNAIALAVNAATPNATVPASSLAGYRAAVVAARAEVNGALASLTGAQAALENARNQLTLAQAGATAQDIESQKAVVAQAQAAVASSEVALHHAWLLAPFDGTVENLTAKIGQITSPGVPVLSLINNSGVKVQAYVSEGDVAKLKAGDAANITLDAFGTGTTFPATITTIASTETQVSGSNAYEVTLHFTNPDKRIKDGMTGNVHIIVGEHDNVVEVPTHLVIESGNDYFVLLQRGSQSVKQSVNIGLTGDDGMTEITSGVNAGDTLTNF